MYVRSDVRRVVSDSQADTLCAVQCCGAVPVLSSISIIYDGRDLRSSTVDLDNQCVKVAGGAAGPGQVGRR